MKGTAMRIAIYGAGGVGACLGGRLQVGGHDAVFIARGANLSALRSPGLHIKSMQGDLELPKASVTDNPFGIGSVDVVVLGVKLYDLERAAIAKAIVEAGHHDSAGARGGRGRTPGDCTRGRTGGQGRGLSRLVPEQSGPRRAPKPVLQARPVRAGWSAKHANRQFCRGTERLRGRSQHLHAYSNRPVAQIHHPGAVRGHCLPHARKPGAGLNHPASHPLLVDAVSEIAATATARNIGLPDDVVAATLQAIPACPPAWKPSMLVDLDAGRPLELDSLSGAGVYFAKAARVPTPMHELAYRVLSLHALGGPAQ